MYCGAQVDFVDIDPDTLNLDVAQLAIKLAHAAIIGRLPKIVVPVAFAGQSCDMAGIRQLAQQYGFKIIEDASHAVGASYLGRPVGCGDYADITVFSFHPVKIITTGEGGLLTTQDAYLAERLRRLRSHGITRDPQLMDHGSEGLWYYQQLELGYNYRLTDMQAALGLSQLARLHEFVQRRRVLAARYTTLLTDLPLILPTAQAGADSAWHLYPVRLQTECLLRSHQTIFAALRGAGIGVNLHYIPVHLQPYYRRMGFAPGDFPHAEHYYAQAISLPLFPALSDEQQNQVALALATVLQ